MDGRKLCVDYLDLPVTAEALYEEFCAYVTEQYQNHVSSIPGAKGVLAELTTQVSWLAVASSTPVREGRGPRGSLGIEHFFLKR